MAGTGHHYAAELDWQEHGGEGLVCGGGREVGSRSIGSQIRIEEITTRIDTIFGARDDIGESDRGGGS